MGEWLFLACNIYLMKKWLPALLMLGTLCTQAQTRKPATKKAASKTSQTAVKQQEEKEDVIPVQEETLSDMATPTTPSTTEKPVTTVEGQYGFYLDYPDKSIAIAYDNREEVANRRYGLLETSTRKKVTPFIFESINGFLQNNLSQAGVNGKFGVINMQGQIVIPCIYDDMTAVVDGNMVYWVVSRNGRYGVINDKHEIVVPFDYEYMAKPDNTSAFLQVKKGGLYSLLHVNGKPLLTSWYTHMEVINASGLAIVELAGNKKGLIDTTEKKLIPLEYDVINRSRPFSSTLFFIVQKAGAYGVMGADGKVLVPLQYDRITNVGDNVLLVAKDNKKGLLGLDGQVILPQVYDDIHNDSTYYKVRKNNRFGVVNERGAIIYPVVYNELNRVILTESYNTPFLLAVKDGKKGILDVSTGKARLDFLYDDLIGTRRKGNNGVETFNNALIAVKDGKYGMIETDGDVLLPFEYENMDYLNTVLVIAVKGGKYGVININTGNALLPFEYQFINNKNGTVIAYKDGYEKYRLESNKLIKEENQ